MSCHAGKQGFKFKVFFRVPQCQVIRIIIERGSVTHYHGMLVKSRIVFGVNYTPRIHIHQAKCPYAVLLAYPFRIAITECRRLMTHPFGKVYQIRSLFSHFLKKYRRFPGPVRTDKSNNHGGNYSGSLTRLPLKNERKRSILARIYDACAPPAATSRVHS